jgi:co-chaperonin GroES (HSP10)
MVELRPMNKYLVIDPIAEDEKIAGGLLYRPGNALEKQFRMAKVLAKDECEEARGISVGATILYDAIGSVSHRVGNQSFTTVRVLNVLAVVEQREAA